MGKDFHTTGTMLQSMFSRKGGIDQWAASHNCMLGLEKYQLCQLTRKREREVFRPRKTRPLHRPGLRLNGHLIKAQPVVKLLGIHIDQELRWKAQAAAALGKGQHRLMQMGRLARVSKGISTALMRRLYVSTALPRIMYGGDVFLTPTQHRPGAMLEKNNQAIVRQLASIQRRVAILITSGMASSLADALDVHAHLLPVHLLIDKVLYRAALRFTTLPPAHPLYEAVKNAALQHVKRHPTPLHYLLNNYPGLKPHLVETIAAMRMKPTWTPNLAIRVADTKERAKQEDEVDRARVKVYSDGSGLEGQIGAAVVLYRDGELRAVKRYKLGSEKHHTVYEGEGIGMLLGMELLREERDEVGGMVPLGVDSQAAIVAMSKIKLAPSHYIWDAFHRHLRAATTAHPDMDLLLRWTPGHMDIDDNEMADFHAKSAILEGPSGALPKFLQRRLPKSQSALKQARNARLQKAAAARWRKSPRYARLANIDSTLPSPSYLKLIANLPRKHAAILFQLRTRHAPLAKHLFRLQKAESPACPSCHMHDDTVDHFLLFCPAHDQVRRLMLHEGGPDTQHKSRLLSQARMLPHLFRFIARSGCMRAVYRDLLTCPIPSLPSRVTEGSTLMPYAPCPMPPLYIISASAIISCGSPLWVCPAHLLFLSASPPPFCQPCPFTCVPSSIFSTI